ncbi:MAG: hypothetical protein M1830_007992, partial [Pleopsidium flavum]
FPHSLNYEERVVLLRSSYVHLTPPIEAALPSSTHTFPGSLSTSHFYVDNNLYYPDKVQLLESLIKVILEDKDTGYLKTWQTLLRAWAISYVYGELNVENDALDVCEDADVKSWFNKAIRRDQGGLDRTITKRKGRIARPGTDTTSSNNGAGKVNVDKERRWQGAEEEVRLARGGRGVSSFKFYRLS